jgi:tetratricopeptide (TPR) repeat protein
LELARYQEALRHAQTACRLSDDFGAFQNTLGVAQYRLGRHADAVQTLTASQKKNAVRVSLLKVLTDPSDAAFLALAHHQLGNRKEAERWLAELRKSLQDSRWRGNSEARGFLAEAESLLTADKK